MWRALLFLAVSRPRQLGAHAQTLALLALSQTLLVARGWRRQTRLEAAALAAATVAALLGGMALLLWAALPVNAMPRPWLLLATPAVPLLLALVFVLAARRQAAVASFAPLLLQLRSDAVLLRDSAPDTALLLVAAQLARQAHRWWRHAPRQRQDDGVSPADPGRR